jgi:amidohydrolase
VSVEEFLVDHGHRLVSVRRDLHAHPELGRQEHRTTGLIAESLAHVGLSPRVLPSGTGVMCDVGDQPPTIALRADIDALPIPDVKDVPYRSTVDGVAHACGHDVHTTVLLGTGLALARVAARDGLPRGVRLVFQPAEELIPGGALDAIDAGAAEGIERFFAVHCDPMIDVGQVGLKAGSITSASDLVEVTVTGPGGHTARPHLTVDLVSALGAVVSQTPGLLARRVDPRAGVALVWGQVNSGTVSNVIPRTGAARGTLRTLSRDVWHTLPPLLDDVVRSVASPYGVGVEVTHTRGVPPVVNDSASLAQLREATLDSVGADAVTGSEQSLGGEDFGWYLEQAPGALARLGVRSPGSQVRLDLHQSSFDVDERCIAVGVKLLSGLALSPR